MTAAEVADSTAGARVLVVGSPPPGGRDLDLLARPAEAAAVAAALRAAGYTSRGTTWARFAGGTADVVELIPAAEWGHEDALFGAARPLADFRRLAVPAPHHELLIAATRFLSASGRLPAGRERRLRSGPAEDPEAWRRARDEAPAWGAVEDLERLASALAGARPVRRRAAAAHLRRRPRGAVVALSGVDGSGKSAQARALVQALDALGHEGVVEWAPLAGDQWLDALAGPLKRLLSLVPALRPPPDAPEEVVRERGIVPSSGSVLRARSPAVAGAWSALVAVANGLQHLRRITPHLAAGRVVVFDRYVLDSLVRLHFLYGEDVPMRLQRRIISALSPSPVAAFHFDVAPEVSLARKDDKWTAEELEAQVRLYRREHSRLDVHVLDGTRSVDDLAAEVAERVWRALP